MEPWIWALIVPIGLALVGALWKLSGHTLDKSEAKLTKDIERVDQYAKTEIARLDKRIDDRRDDHVKLHERAAVSEAEIKRIKEEIGDHNTGIRGWLHQVSNSLNPIAMWFQLRDRFKDDHK